MNETTIDNYQVQWDGYRVYFRDNPRDTDVFIGDLEDPKESDHIGQVTHEDVVNLCRVKDRYKAAMIKLRAGCL
jgi:hypothetical protein